MKWFGSNVSPSTDVCNTLPATVRGSIEQDVHALYWDDSVSDEDRERMYSQIIAGYEFLYNHVLVERFVKECRESEHFAWCVL